MQVYVEQNDYAVSGEEIIDWIQRSGDVVSLYYDGFPMEEVFVAVTGSEGKGVLRGIALGEAGGVVNVKIGFATDTEDLRNDWVLVHELIHLAFPKVHRKHHWIEEGLSVYVEATARAQAGDIDAETIWRSFSRGMPNGLPKPGERGLDNTPTWGRIYWGGALFFLMADMEIIRRSGGRKSLRDGLRAIVSSGYDISINAKPLEVFAIADAAAGTPVLRELYSRMSAEAEHIDLDRMWRELGVVVAHNSVRLVDDASLAYVRKTITSPESPYSPSPP